MNLIKKRILLFETIKVENYEAQNLEFHLERVKNSIKKESNFDFKNIIKAPNNGLFRAKVIYNENGNLVDCRLFKYKMRNFKNFKILKSDVNYERKFLDRSALDEIFAQRGANDDVLIEKNGILPDTTIANIAILQNDIWITPKNPLLKGTTRKRLLNNGFLIERDFSIKELLNAQSFAILNAMIDFLEIKMRNLKFIKTSI